MSIALATLLSDFAQCDECKEWVESGFVDDYGWCVDCDKAESYSCDYDGQPDEAQEWHDFDPDCQTQDCPRGLTPSPKLCGAPLPQDPSEAPSLQAGRICPLITGVGDG